MSVPSCIVIFNSSFVSCIRGQSLESKFHLIKYYAHLLVSRAPPTKCNSSFHEHTDISMAVSIFLLVCLLLPFT